MVIKITSDNNVQLEPNDLERPQFVGYLNQFFTKMTSAVILALTADISNLLDGKQKTIHLKLLFHEKALPGKCERDACIDIRSSIRLEEDGASPEYIEGIRASLTSLENKLVGYIQDLNHNPLNLPKTYLPG